MWWYILITHNKKHVIARFSAWLILSCRGRDRLAISGDVIRAILRTCRQYWHDPWALAYHWHVDATCTRLQWLSHDSHNHMAKAIWVAQELKLHRQLPQRRYAISGAIFGFSRSVFYIKANPAVSRKFPGRFPSVPRTALWPFLKFPCGNWWTKRKGRFQPLPSYLPARM